MLLEAAATSLHERASADVGVYVALLGQPVERAAASELAPKGAQQISGASGQISFSLGLTGPCVTLDTACSSWLVAANLARAAVFRSECSLATAAGAGILGAACGRSFSLQGMLSERGRCHTYDSRADGYCRGEGCVVVVL